MLEIRGLCSQIWGAQMTRLLTTSHDRGSAGLTYVYPVLSRRSGGLSIGINLNTNHCCNWRCIYCQVPNLRRGRGPHLHLELLEKELFGFLADVINGDFYERMNVPEELRMIRDIAISGNGEPTTSPQLSSVIGIIAKTADRFHLRDSIKFILITNGSQTHREEIQRALSQWQKIGGEVWFKIDSATSEGISQINQVRLSPIFIKRNFDLCARLCPTWIQTCVFGWEGKEIASREKQAYVNFLKELRLAGIPFRGVLLYGVARAPMGEKAPLISRLSPEALEKMANVIRELGIPTTVFP